MFRGGTPNIKIQEIDGSPAGRPRTLKITNATLTDNGDGTFTLDILSVTDGRYLKIDQSTPESITNGAPTFTEGLKISAGKKLIFDA